MKIAIIAALHGELRPLAREWKQLDADTWSGEIGGHSVFAIAGGVGQASAARAVERALAEANPEVLVSYGWTGALTCAVKPPSACVINEVVDDSSGERFAASISDGYRLITLDHVALSTEKRALAGKHQAVLVDMEAAAVARIAKERKLPFYAFKGISDGYLDELPDFSLFMENGKLKMPSFLAHVAVRPRYWGSLQRLNKMTRASAESLAALAQEFLRQSL
jgi:adenosylhomocysteine nucleosidase